MYRSAEQMKKQRSTDIKTYAHSVSHEMNAEREANSKSQ